MPNVRNEINYALKLNKPFFAIHLDETDLPPGMDLQMSSIQAILKWRMNEQAYVRNLERALPRTFGAPVRRDNAATPSAESGESQSADIVDLFARTLHSEYQIASLSRGIKPQNWHQLATDVKDGFLVQSRFMLSMLYIAGFSVNGAADGDPVPVFPEGVLDLLARLEHDRWARERIDAGWRFAKTKSNEQKLTPYLLPWDEMPADVREYDRAAVRQLPELLMRSGYTITSLYKEPERKSVFTLANNRMDADGK